MKNYNTYEIFKETDGVKRELEKIAIGEYLAERMIRDSLSRAEMAKKLGCSNAYLTRILRGTSNLKKTKELIKKYEVEK